MQVPNPLIPPQFSASAGAPSAVSNAPSVQDDQPHETSRPVTASSESDRPRPQDERTQGDDQQPEPRGSKLDISV